MANSFQSVKDGELLEYLITMANNEANNEGVRFVMGGTPSSHPVVTDDHDLVFK